MRRPTGLCWWWLLEFVWVPGQAWPPTGIQRRPKATRTTSSPATALLPPFIPPYLPPSVVLPTLVHKPDNMRWSCECVATSNAHIRVTHSSLPWANSLYLRPVRLQRTMAQGTLSEVGQYITKALQFKPKMHSNLFLHVCSTIYEDSCKCLKSRSRTKLCLFYFYQTAISRKLRCWSAGKDFWVSITGCVSFPLQLLKSYMLYFLENECTNWENGAYSDMRLKCTKLYWTVSQSKV